MSSLQTIHCYSQSQLLHRTRYRIRYCTRHPLRRCMSPCVFVSAYDTRRISVSVTRYHRAQLHEGRGGVLMTPYDCGIISFRNVFISAKMAPLSLLTSFPHRLQYSRSHLLQSYHHQQSRRNRHRPGWNIRQLSTRQHCSQVATTSNNACVWRMYFIPLACNNTAPAGVIMSKPITRLCAPEREDVAPLMLSLYPMIKLPKPTLPLSSEAPVPLTICTLTPSKYILPAYLGNSE